MTRRDTERRHVVAGESVGGASVSLESVEPVGVRRALARLVENLVELQERAGKGRDWVSAEEWGRVSSGSRWSLTLVRKQRERARDLLERVGGPELRCDQGEDDSETRVYVATPELLRFAADRFDEARRVLYPEDLEPEAESRVEPEPGDLVDLAQLRENYRGISERSGTWALRRRFRIGWSRLVKLLGSSRSRRRGRRLVDETRPAEVVEEARKRVLAGASVAEVKQVLKCSFSAARAFARRVWNASRQAMA